MKHVVAGCAVTIRGFAVKRNLVRCFDVGCEVLVELHPRFGEKSFVVVSFFLQCSLFNSLCDATLLVLRYINGALSCEIEGFVETIIWKLRVTCGTLFRVLSGDRRWREYRLYLPLLFAVFFRFVWWT